MALLKRIFPLLFFLLTFGWILRVLFLSGYPDYQVHYYGAQHLVQHTNPYLNDDRYFTPQVYPPFDMVFFIPLSFLSYDISSKVWIILSIAAILLSIYLINKMYKVSFFSSINLFLSALVFMAFPTKFTLGMGQINAFILLFTTLLIFYLNKKNDITSGIAFAFPVMLKFFPLLFIPYFIFLKKFKLLFAFLLTAFGLFLVSLFFVPFAIQYHFFTQMLPDLLASWKGDYYNQSLTGVLMRQIPDADVRQLLRVAIPLLMLVINFLIIISKRSNTQTLINLELSSLIILSLLINNFSWQHHFILLLLPFLIMTYSIKEKSLYIILAIAYALITINFQYPSTVPVILQSHVFFGALLLWITNLYMIYATKKVVK